MPEIHLYFYIRGITTTPPHTHADKQHPQVSTGQSLPNPRPRPAFPIDRTTTNSTLVRVQLPQFRTHGLHFPRLKAKRRKFGALSRKDTVAPVMVLL